MSKRACPFILGDCIGVDSPIIGLSSQADDTRYFYADCSPVSDAFAPPPLGGGIVTQSCEKITLAATTQAEADALAAAVCGGITEESYAAPAVLPKEKALSINEGQIVVTIKPQIP